MSNTSEVSPNMRLRAWLAAHGISIAQFSRDLGYRSNFGYLLVSAKRPITFDTIGRLLKAYGPGIAGELVKCVGGSAK